MKTRDPTILCLKNNVSSHLDDQHGEVFESWMVYLEFEEFPNLIEYYTTIGIGTLLKERTIQSKTVHYLRTLNILCTFPNCISQTTLPTKSYR